MPDIRKVKNPLLCQIEFDRSKFHIDGTQYSNAKNEKKVAKHQYPRGLVVPDFIEFDS
jgi:hypothetical protein